MQELEKILEEIEEEAMHNPEVGRKQCEGMIRAMNIIRNHVSRENDSEITRSSQDTNETEINLPKEEFEMLRFYDSITFRCGNEYISLYMGDGDNEAVRKYKHMNDGWISVEERLPINHEGPVEVTIRAGYRTVGYYDQYREEWWTLDEESILDVIAWKEPSEPYRPERSEGE